MTRALGGGKGKSKRAPKGPPKGQGDLEKGREILDAKMLSRAPVQRWAQPDEIAQAVEFLCAEQSGLITGATIPVDGGLHLV